MSIPTDRRCKDCDITLMEFENARCDYCRGLADGYRAGLNDGYDEGYGEGWDLALASLYRAALPY